MIFKKLCVHRSSATPHYYKEMKGLWLQNLWLHLGRVEMVYSTHSYIERASMYFYRWE